MHSLRELLCLFFCSTAFVTQIHARMQAPVSTGRVEFRLAEIEPGPGLIEAKVDSPLRVVYLHPDAMITNKDIIEARVREEPNILGQYEVIVVFTRKGAERMAIATKENRGLLVVLFDGKVILAMGITRQIRGRASISGPHTKKDAEDLAAMLNKRSG